jgi:predicted nucleotidyltransferase
MVNNKDAVLRTIIYSDLFDYPLTEQEIRKFLIKKIEPDNLRRILKNSKEIESCEGFYFIKGRQRIVSLRKKRQKESLLKIKKAKKIVKILSFIPSILLIGISGSVAVNNSKKEDDIDLFIVTSKNTLWTTRLLMILVLKTMGIYRKRNEPLPENKFCLNMFLSETSIGMKKDRRNLFTAREIAQLIPIFQRKKTYEKLIFKNGWINKFLPNVSGYLKISNENLPNRAESSINLVLAFFEKPAKVFQLSLIKRHITKETVSSNFIAFHPLDVMPLVIAKYKKLT